MRSNVLPSDAPRLSPPINNVTSCMLLVSSLVFSRAHPRALDQRL
jgi:hypothetical protein